MEPLELFVQNAQGQQTPAICQSFPCGYLSRSGDVVIIDGTYSQSPGSLLVDMTLTAGARVGGLNLSLSFSGNDAFIRATIFRGITGPNPGFELGPITIDTVAEQVLFSEVQSHTFTATDIAMLTVMLTGLNNEDYRGSAPMSAAPSMGDSHVEQTCSSGSTGDTQCSPTPPVVRNEPFECSGPITPGGFHWIPFLPLPNPVDIFGGGPESPEVEECCQRHDICMLNTTCLRDEKRCDLDFGSCVRKHASWAEIPWVETALGIMLGTEHGAYLKEPKVGCRCFLEFPETTSSEVAPVSGSQGGETNGEPSAQTLPPHSMIAILHDECCVDNECRVEQSCTATLHQYSLGNNGELLISDVGEIPGHCVKYPGEGPTRPVLPPSDKFERIKKAREINRKD